MKLINASVVAAAAVLCASGGLRAAGDTTIVEAARIGDRQAVRALLEDPAAVNTPSADGTTALHWAVRAGDLEITDLLIRAGANVSAANRYGVTPLALAALNGNATMTGRLLDAGADANTKSPEGETVLMIAARTGNAAVVRQLLARGADPNAREGWLGQTALMWAAHENHADVVALLLETRADAYVAGRIYPDADLKPLDAGTPKANESRGGMTALHFAARQGALEAVKVMADKGVDLDQADPDGVTALLYAALNGHADTAALLLEKGADPNLADAFGRTVLYAAIDLNTWESMAPRPAPKTDDTTTPLELARLALARGAYVNAPITGPLPPRSTQGNNDSTPQGATPLWRAAKTSDVEAVRLLLDAGADPAIASRDGTTPLMVAAGQAWEADRSRLLTEQQSVDTIRTLLTTGVDINARNNQGETALHGAADRKADTVVAFLAENGARLDLRDTSNRTALDVAMDVPPAGGRPPFAYRDPTPKESTAKLLRELMTARGVPIEPYLKPGPKSQSESAQK
jgi:ankyrin repeat protein